MAVHIATQILSPIALLIGTLLFGISPIAVTRTLLKCGCDSEVCRPNCRSRRGKVITSFLIYFGGGVLLATCLVHLLPEAREGFDAIQESDKVGVTSATTEIVANHENQESDDGGHEHEHFSLAEFTVCCGFFAVYLLEVIVQFFLGGHGHSHIPNESRAIRTLSRSGSCSSAKMPPEHANHLKTFQDSTKVNPTSESMDPICQEAEPVNAGCCSTADISLTGLFTVIALSFHSLFEGFAIGIQSKDSRVWILFGAVAVHKFVIAFVVGLEVLASGGKRNLVIIYMSVFSLMSPIGMTAAFITQSSIEDSNPTVVGVLNAIATGTLLYVTFCEILQREEENKNLAGWQQFLATFFGFGVMCLVQYISTLA